VERRDLAENLSRTQEVQQSGKTDHLAKDCWEKHFDEKPTAKTRPNHSLLRRSKGRGKGASFEELMRRRTRI